MSKYYTLMGRDRTAHQRIEARGSDRRTLKAQNYHQALVRAKMSGCEPADGVLQALAEQYLGCGGYVAGRTVRLMSGLERLPGLRWNLAGFVRAADVCFEECIQEVSSDWMRIVEKWYASERVWQPPHECCGGDIGWSLVSCLKRHPRYDRQVADGHKPLSVAQTSSRALINSAVSVEAVRDTEEAKPAADSSLTLLGLFPERFVEMSDFYSQARHKPGGLQAFKLRCGLHTMLQLRERFWCGGMLDTGLLAAECEVWMTALLPFGEHLCGLLEQPHSLSANGEMLMKNRARYHQTRKMVGLSPQCCVWLDGSITASQAARNSPTRLLASFVAECSDRACEAAVVAADRLYNETCRRLALGA